MSALHKSDEKMILELLSEYSKRFHDHRECSIVPRGHIPSNTRLKPHEIKHLILSWSAQIRAWLELGQTSILDLNFQLEQNGIRVFTTVLPGKISGLSLLMDIHIPLILINEQDSCERRTFTLSRELAMLTLCHEWLPILKPQALVFPVKPFPEGFDKILNAAAGELLMPEKALLKIHHRWPFTNLSYENLLHLKCAFGVSAEAILNQLLTLKLISVVHGNKLLKQIRAYYAKTDFREPYSSQQPGAPLLSKNIGLLFDSP